MTLTSHDYQSEVASTHPAIRNQRPHLKKIPQKYRNFSRARIRKKSRRVRSADHPSELSTLKPWPTPAAP